MKFISYFLYNNIELLLFIMVKRHLIKELILGNDVLYFLRFI